MEVLVGTRVPNDPIAEADWEKLQADLAHMKQTRENDIDTAAAILDARASENQSRGILDLFGSMFGHGQAIEDTTASSSSAVQPAKGNPNTPSSVPKAIAEGGKQNAGGWRKHRVAEGIKKLGGSYVNEETGRAAIRNLARLF